ncbi:MAG: hypothetical protein ACREYF_13770 [Gammaproteobacteria bacterium]
MKDEALGYIADSTARIAANRQDAKLLAQALEIGEMISVSVYKGYALREISYAAARLGNWRQARRLAQSIENGALKATALSRILLLWAEQTNPTLAQPDAE